MAETQTEQQSTEGEITETAGAAVQTRPTHHFLCQLSAPEGEDNVETVPYRLSLTVPTRRRPAPDYVTPVFYSPVEEAPLEAEVWLQLWEMDLFRSGPFAANEETDFANEQRNQLLATIPGIVVREESGSTVKFSFRALGGVTPARSRQPLAGSVKLEVPNAAGEYQEHEILLGEYESVLELVAVLRPRANDSSMDLVDNCSAVTFVHNVHASVRRQLATRDGIAVAFVTDYDISNWREDTEQRNDKELSRQGSSMVSTLPTFKKTDDGLRFGYYLLNGFTQIAAKLQEVRELAKTELGLNLLPKVSTLTFYAHGVRQRIQLVPKNYSASGSLRVDNCAEFVDHVLPHLSEEVVVALFACNTGRGRRAGSNHGTTDATYGHALVGEHLGIDSLGWTLCRELESRGKEASVWAHTTAGHTTRNRHLRLFSSWGDADFTSFLFGGRSVTRGTRRHYFSRTNPAEPSRLTYANLIRAISLQSGRYLPWEWSGQVPDPEDLGYVALEAQVTTNILDRLREVMLETELTPEEWTYEDSSKRIIVGRSAEADDDSKLSEHFDLPEFLEVARGPIRLGVRLVQALEALRDRSRTAVKIEALVEGGEGVHLKINASRYDRVLEEARKLVAQKLLHSVHELEGNRLFLSDSGLSYESDLGFVTGCDGERRERARITRSIPWSQINQPVSLPTCRVAQRLMDTRSATLLGVNADGTQLKLGHEDLDALEASAARYLGEGIDGLAIEVVTRQSDGVLIGLEALEAPSNSKQGAPQP